MTDSTQYATLSESTASTSSNSSLQIQIQPKSQIEFAPRDSEKSGFLDWVDFGGVLSVETAVAIVCILHLFIANVTFMNSRGLLHKHTHTGQE